MNFSKGYQMEIRKPNEENLDYILHVVKETMGHVLEATKDSNVMEPIYEELDLPGVQGSLIQTLVVKRLKEKSNKKA